MSAVPAPRPKRFTSEEFSRLGELGFLDERTELIDGEILQMPRIGPRHAHTINRLPAFLAQHTGKELVIRSQAPLDLGTSQPQPDIAIVAGPEDSYREAHPKKALLVIEISQSTLSFDREVKSGIYSQAGIPEYWIIDLDSGRVEVRREPKEGVGYAEIRLYTAGEVVAPMARPEALLKVEDLLSPP